MRLWRFSSGIALLLSGCITVTVPQPQPGEYSNFREMAYRQMQMLSFPNVSDKTQAEFRTCAVDAMYPYYTPKEIETLDAYARGEQALNQDQIQSLNRTVADRMGGHGGTSDGEALLSVMNTKCPGTVSEIRQAGGKPDLSWSITR
jgi:hypothetical protein